ncbi:pyruvate ferredoxin/flavodoxin oxidoreductase [Candidatus Thiomargarita nelsonii]|uniref:Pyruvate ferredoxin/flavodoxin oxidoreductase n=1 Tax=Candidatus Thiomargarita nelsonii TaxID=1003181 RepID=A0A176S0C5_9GAMM|nr:pyruvate ferredoxin/flavodoxin oxidoreductase [Candidatus Thiomargarita nelsonii]
MKEQGKNPLQLDSKQPKIPLKDFTETEVRFSSLSRSAPEDAERFLQQAQENVTKRYRHYKQLADLSFTEEK